MSGRRFHQHSDKSKKRHLQKFHSDAPSELDHSVKSPNPNEHLSTQSDRNNNAAVDAILFGPFQLLPQQRLLLEGDRTVQVGSRALEILIALLRTPGELVGKDQLMARVWPKTFVESANLTVHIAALRRALNDGQAGNRYLINIPGRGYRFVAPVRREKVEVLPSPGNAAFFSYNLPRPVTQLIGRRDVITKLKGQLSYQRLVTVAGPGGIGKTSVALAVAEKLARKYDHGVCMIDLASLKEPHLVPGAIAAGLGIKEPSQHPMADVIATLAGRQMLLLLDNCEHLIGAGAEAANDILQRAPNVHILASSREPMRVEGEHVYRLAQLEVPPASASLSAVEALAFPSVQLFVERAAETLGAFKIDDAEASVVAEICRRLGGVPLAIELAAARVGTLGIQGIATHLDNSLRVLLTHGHRTTHPRQQSMRATLDWSYVLLTELEQVILRRVSVLDGSFTLPAIVAIAADANYSESDIIAGVLDLVAKSMIMADQSTVDVHFSLLETTRAYARIKLEESDERDAAYRRRIEYKRDRSRNNTHASFSFSEIRQTHPNKAITQRRNRRDLSSLVCR